MTEGVVLPVEPLLLRVECTNYNFSMKVLIDESSSMEKVQYTRLFDLSVLHYIHKRIKLQTETVILLLVESRILGA